MEIFGFAKTLKESLKNTKKFFLKGYRVNDSRRLIFIMNKRDFRVRVARRVLLTEGFS
jgi:hypothetical protein